jgi:hypothetical protein
MAAWRQSRRSHVFENDIWSVTLKSTEALSTAVDEISSASSVPPYGIHAGTARLGHLKIGFEVSTPMSVDVWMPGFAQELHKREILGSCPESLAASYKPLPVGPWSVSSCGQTWGMSGIFQFEKTDDGILRVHKDSHFVFGVAKNSRGSQSSAGFPIASECVGEAYNYYDTSGGDAEILDRIMGHMFFFLSYPATIGMTRGRAWLEEASFYRDYFLPAPAEFIKALASVEFSNSVSTKPTLKPLPGAKDESFLSWFDTAAGVEVNLYPADENHLRAEVFFRGRATISGVAKIKDRRANRAVERLTERVILPMIYALPAEAAPYLDDIDEFIQPGGRSGVTASVFERVVLS